MYFRPQVQLVAASAAGETVEGILFEIHRKRTAVSGFRMVNRARTPELRTVMPNDFEREEFEYLGHRNRGADCGKINTRHGVSE